MAASPSRDGRCRNDSSRVPGRVEVSVFDNPFLDPWHHPEAVDAESDDHKQEPLDPQSEKLDSGTDESEAATVDARVLCTPSLAEHDAVRRRDAQC